MNIVRTSISLSLNEDSFEHFSRQKNKSYYIQELIEKDTLNAKESKNEIALGTAIKSLENEIRKLVEVITSGEIDVASLEKKEPDKDAEVQEKQQEDEHSLSEGELATLNAFMNWGEKNE